MNAIEQMNFVTWAKDRYPKFTQNRKDYVSALWAWRKVARKDPMVDKVIKSCYN